MLLPIFQPDNTALDTVRNAKRASRNYARLMTKRLELFLLVKKLRATKGWAERNKHNKRVQRTQHKRAQRIQQEIILLKSEVRSAKKRVGDASEMGTLPDFVIIGAMKCGTTFLYNLLAQHPHVDAAAAKELHYFNSHFDEGIEWYRRYFPQQRWKAGRRTITGEATPYLHRLPVPKRMAEVIPQARLIVLLRNPVDRTYSDYLHMRTKRWYKKGWETRTFEEAIEAEKAWLLDKGGEDKTFKKDHTSLGYGPCRYLPRSIYIDQLLHWSGFFSEEQMLVLKSEDLFERTLETLQFVLDFLDLPHWEPEAMEIPNKGRYEREMHPGTRQQLEEYFEPHNRRLYEYLGVDFGW
jgi:hypothetical protein